MEWFHLPPPADDGTMGPKPNTRQTPPSNCIHAAGDAAAEPEMV